MTPEFIRTYRRLRALGLHASFAFYGAKTQVAWEQEAEAGNVRMSAFPDTDYEWNDYSGCRASDRKRYEREERDLVEREGVWVYAAEYLWEGRWHLGDDSSLSGCVGALAIDYEAGMRESALEALYARREQVSQEAAEELASRATFAGPGRVSWTTAPIPLCDLEAFLARVRSGP